MQVDLWTDGGCYPNPGPGAWAFILVAYGPVLTKTGTPTRRGERRGRKIGEIERCGVSQSTTNNAMELTAVIRGLREVRRPTSITVYTDSEYVVLGMQRRLAEWKARGWRLAGGGPVKNRELWEALEAAARPHTIAWTHVRGHTGEHYNERCDALCTAAYRKVA